MKLEDLLHAQKYGLCMFVGTLCPILRSRYVLFTTTKLSLPVACSQVKNDYSPAAILEGMCQEHGQFTVHV